MKPALGHATTPDGRVVVLMWTAWRHVLDEHPEMAIHRVEVLETVASPHVVHDDPEAGRQRFHRSGVGPSRWLRVVVDFNQRPALIITAFGIRKENPA